MARLGETGDGAPSASAVSGFESDLADLIDDHVRACGGDLSFDAFRAHWQSRSFSFVHNARLVELLEGEYAQMLFSATMPYLAPDAGPTVRRIAALYALHLLYHTQQLTPRARVYVTPRDVRRLAQLMETCVSMGAADAVRAAKELVDDHAFAVGVSDRTREEALDDALAEATAATAGRPKKRKTFPRGDLDARVGAPRTRDGAVPSRDAGLAPVSDEDTRHSDEDAVSERARSSAEEDAAEDVEEEDPAATLRARVAAASRGALEHLRATRVPASFQALAEDSTRYGACMAALTRRGDGSKGEEGGRDTSRAKNRAETRTAEMHELVRRQVVKYDGKLRAALRPETASSTPRNTLGSVLDILRDPSADGSRAPRNGVDRDAGGSGPHLGSERDLRRLGLPAARPLRDTPRFGSMPDFPGLRGGEGKGGTRSAAARASRLREESDGESDGE